MLAEGVATGFLKTDGTVDVDRCDEFSRSLPEAEFVFHRAFDLVPDFPVAIDQLVAAGVDRILTSGAAATAVAGVNRLRMCVDHADGRIEILPGSGIRAANVAEIIHQTKCRQIHTSAGCHRLDTSAQRNPEIHFGGNPSLPSGSYGVADREQLRELLMVLHARE